MTDLEGEEKATPPGPVDMDMKVCGIPAKAIMLICICFLTFGSYWVFDTPGAIFTQLQDWFGGSDKYSSSDNLLLYSIYSIPNTVLAFFGGLVIDRFTGVRLGALLFCTLILVGQIVFCIGVQAKQYYICLAGRFIFGLGGESLTVAQNIFTLRWFAGPQLALAFGLVLSFARIGSSVNFVATPQLADTSVPFAVWFGAGTCLFSVVMCLIACGIDYTAEKKQTQKNADNPIQVVEEEEELPSISQVKDFPLAAWLLFFICLFFYICVLTFYTVASDIMQHTGEEFASTTATLFLAVPNFVSIFCSPMFGSLVDEKGRALNLILSASCMMVLGHLAFLFMANGTIKMNPIFIMLWIGVAYALGAACIWPILALAIEPHMKGTGYGTMTAVQNMGLALFPFVIGQLQTADAIDGTTWKYTIPILIFIGCAGVAVSLTVILMRVDISTLGGVMNMSASERAAVEKQNAVDADYQKLITGEVGTQGSLNQRSTARSTSARRKTSAENLEDARIGLTPSQSGGVGSYVRKQSFGF